MGVVSNTYDKVPTELGSLEVDSIDPNPLVPTRTIEGESEDLRIVDWIGKFVKPLEERVANLERQVEFLRSLVVNPVIEVEFKKSEE